MKRRTSLYLALFFSLMSLSLVSQELVDIEGKVIAEEDLEGIHIINESESKYAVTDINGEFIILAKLNDTLVLSGIKYKPKRLVINAQTIETQRLIVSLEEMVNELDPVIVGKVLSGDLGSDLENVEAEPAINFYDLGIPGYSGPRKTQAERRLYAATSGSGLIPLMPILNALTGRTKELKRNLKMQQTEQHIDLARSKYSNVLFKDAVDTKIISRFFFYVSLDERFLPLSQKGIEIDILDFLINKKKAFFAEQGVKDED